MPARPTRHMGIREVATDDCKVLAVVPVFNGESLLNLRAHWSTNSLPAAHAANNVPLWTGNMGYIEVNYAVLAVPWHILSTYVQSAGNTPTVPADVGADWDRLARRLLLEYGTDGNEFYGANPDDRPAYDAQRNVWFRRRGSDTTGDDRPGTPQNDVDTGDTRPQDEPLADLFGGPTYGPVGVQRLYAKEEFLTAKAVQPLIKPFKGSGLATFLGLAIGAIAQRIGSVAGGLPDMAFGHDFDVLIPGGFRGPGAILFIVTRFAAGQTTTRFSFGFGAGSGTSQTAGEGLSTAQASARNRALQMLVGGDLQRVQAELRYDTGFLGDYLRSVLFAGDNYIEKPSIAALMGTAANADTAATDLYSAATPAYLRDNMLVSGVKMMGHIQTPYTMSIL